MHSLSPRSICVRRSLAAIACGAALLAGSRAQTPQLVRDINPVAPVNESSYVGGGVLANGWLLLSAYSMDGNGTERGGELFRTLGFPGTTSLVREIRPGSLGSRPRAMARLGNFAVFTADEANGRALWRTDGTPAGTSQITTIAADPTELVVWNGRLYFLLGATLWVCDGTGAGTVAVRTFQIGFFDSPVKLVSFGNSLYLTGTDSSTGRELWRSDGTTAGTVLVHDIVPGSAGSEIDHFAVHGNRLYFTAKTANTGRELWSTDGTSAGTGLVFDVNPGPEDGIQVTRSHQEIPVAMGSAGAYLFFMGFTPNQGLELWRTDGTATGTILLRDLHPGSADGMPDRMVALGPDLIFGARTGSSTFGLWKSDGTPAGTTQLTGIDAPPRAMLEVGTRVYFNAFDLQFGRELWSTDGTVAGTGLVHDILPGTKSSDPTNLAIGPTGGLLFCAEDGVHGRELWSSNGTSAGTMLVDDIHRPRPGSTQSSSPRQVVGGEGVTWFTAHDGVAAGLWRTDGTTAGTTLVRRTPVGGGDYVHLMPVGAGLFFNAADGAGTELWHSDGTTAGTARVGDIVVGPGSSYPRDGIALGDRLVFTAESVGQGREVWVSDGTATGTTLLRDLRPGPSGSLPSHLTRLGNSVFFLAYDGAGNGLWRTDGTAAGTSLVQAIPWGATGLCRVGDLIYLFEPAYPSQLWASDGTPQGTRVAFVLPPGARTGRMIAKGSTLLLLTDAQLWRIDGATTTLVRDLSAGALYQQFASNPAVAGSRLFFSAKTGNLSRDVLWVSDGTTAGTHPVSLGSGAFAFTGSGGSSGDSSIVAVGDWQVFFPAAAQPFDPFELWSSDGTASGTGLVADLWPGTPSSNPGSLIHSHGRLLFTADDGLHGRELWSLDVGANSQTLGFGCAASGRPPRLSSGDPVLGVTMQFDLVSPHPTTRGVLGLGAPSTPPGLRFPGGCWIPVDYGLPAILLFFQTDALGSWRLSVPVPNDPNLLGVELAAQVGVTAPATAPLGLDLSNALLLRAGR